MTKTRTRIVQIKYVRAADKTINLTQLLIGGVDHLDVPTLDLDTETSWFVEGEGELDGDVIMVTLVRDPSRSTQPHAIERGEVEGMFASRKRVEDMAAKSGHKLTSWDMLDKQTAGQSWIGATCMICRRVLELEPIATTPERVAHYRPRTSFHLRKCQLQS